MFEAILASGALAALACQPAEDPSLTPKLSAIAQGWDEARYEIQDERSQIVALRLLAAETQVLASQHPGAASVRVWLGVLLAGEADDADWLAALRLADQARQALISAESQCPDHPTAALLETALGVLFAEAPPRPLSFGDAAQAEAHFRRGLAADPTGIEQNYYYADFLADRRRFPEAEDALRKALAAPARPGRDLGDRGVRQAAATLLAEIRRHRPL